VTFKGRGRVRYVLRIREIWNEYRMWCGNLMENHVKDKGDASFQIGSFDISNVEPSNSAIVSHELKVCSMSLSQETTCTILPCP
jgi:hypothetical protein